jgi:orotate phosphoribosyltransferase
MAPRDELLRLLVEKSFRVGQFTLASGAQSDYYIDCRATTLSAAGAPLVGRAVLDEIDRRGWRARAIGGLTLGADPIALATALASTERSTPLDAFVVRKAEKQHGTGQRMEGFREPGAAVVVVDDVCTTGGSTIQAIAAVRAAGMEVAGVICLVDREEQNGRANVEQAAAPAEFVALFTMSELKREYARRHGATAR